MILDGEARRADRRTGGDAVRARRVLRRDLPADGRAADRGRRRAATLLRCLVIPGPEFEPFLLEHPRVLLPDAPGGGAPAPRHDRVEERLLSPFPPGDYDVVVVGTGPGGLQTSYCLTRAGVSNHALLSADDAPGGMFRRFPVFERLISWTKPDAPCERQTREYECYDHNSLVADEPEAARPRRRLHGPELRRPGSRRDGGGDRRLRRAGRHPGPLRLPLEGDAARGRRGSCSRRPTASTAAAPPSSRSG